MTEQQTNFSHAVFRTIDTLFAGTAHQTYRPDNSAYDFLTLDGDIYHFNFNGRHHPSDSLSELVEIAIRLVEKEISSRLIPGGVPFTIVKMGVPDEEFAKCFKVLERPYRLEMYTDTFRKGVLELRKLYCV